MHACSLNFILCIAQHTLTVVFTGHTGTGKSAAGNFFIGKEIFKSEVSFGSITTKSAAETAIIAQQSVQIIDTPGFMDAMLPDKIDTYELTHALILARNGVHAFGIVIDASKRFDQSYALSLQELLSSFGKKIIRYVFVLFTHAASLGDKKEQLQVTGKDEKLLKAKIEKMLASPGCPPQLLQLLQLTNNQYMILETQCYNEQSDYHEKKCNELIVMINQVQEKNERKPLTLGIFILIKEIYEQIIRKNQDGEEDINPVSEIQSSLEEAKKKHEPKIGTGKMGSFWDSVAEDLFLTLGTVAGGAVGAYVGQPVFGALVGQGAGRAVGRFVDKKFCTLQ